MESPTLSDDALFACPCCGLPTLESQAGFDICPVCWWEDDGQSDEDANVVRGGPNGGYSLTGARENYRDHGDMYDRNEGIDTVKHPSPEREALRDYALAVTRGQADLVVSQLDGLIDAEEKARIADEGED